MERLWLRPLSRVPKKQYLKLAKKMAARPIEQGTRPHHKYFFNLAASLALKKKTLAWDSTQRSSLECILVVDCSFRGTGTSVHDRVLCN
jgi:hypothetical protein